jgi:hypothetical protein
VAYSGYLLVALCQAVAEPLEGEFTRIQKSLSVRSNAGTLIDVGDLKSWSGTSPSEMIDRNEEVVPDEHLGSLLGCVVDRRKLAWFLEHLEGVSELLVWDASDIYGVPSIGFDWAHGRARALLAGIQWDVQLELPRVFDLKKEGPGSIMALLDSLGSE